MIKVILTAGDIAIARKVGALRYEDILRKRIRNGPQVDRKRPQIELQTDGCYGEMAFERRFGLPMEKDGVLRARAPDFVTPRGTRIDVKSTRYEHGHLIGYAFDKDRDKADVYLLALLHDCPPTVYLMHYELASRVFDERNLKTLQAPTVTYCLRQQDIGQQADPTRGVEQFDDFFAASKAPKVVDAAWVAAYDAELERMGIA